jgi:predicted amidophosphoribosyltransferase
MPVAAHLLRRRRYTGTQTRKTAAERRGNIAGAFALNPRALARLKAAGVHHVLLVDDVLTTGATLSECIRLLSPHFKVSVATLGFVE